MGKARISPASPKIRPTKRDRQKIKTRQKLLRNTIGLIAREGFDGVTMSKVTQKANLSRGMCNYHFETKEQLMVEAFRLIYQEHETAWRSILGDKLLPPKTRLKKLITALLSPPVAEKDKLAVWLAFWGVSSTRKTYFEICEKTDREYENAVEEVLREIAGNGNSINGMTLHAIAVSLTGIIDGLGIQFVISPGQITAEDAIRSCEAYVSAFFPDFKDAQLP